MSTRYTDNDEDKENVNPIDSVATDHVLSLEEVESILHEVEEQNLRALEARARAEDMQRVNAAIEMEEYIAANAIVIAPEEEQARVEEFSQPNLEPDQYFMNWVLNEYDGTELWTDVMWGLASGEMLEVSVMNDNFGEDVQEEGVIDEWMLTLPF